MSFAIFCNKCSLGSFSECIIENFICDNCNQPERLSEKTISNDGSDSLNSMET